jgi:hypothetical protein
MVTTSCCHVQVQLFRNITFNVLRVAGKAQPRVPDLRDGSHDTSNAAGSVHVSVTVFASEHRCELCVAILFVVL